MATRTHQLILGLIVQAMRNDGVEIHNIDGAYPGMFGEKMPLPPRIINHRPDILGVKNNGQVCIGEAKTKNDIHAERTETQIRDYISININGMPCAVYLGVPQSAKADLNNLFVKLMVHGDHNIVVVIVPDELINE